MFPIEIHPAAGTPESFDHLYALVGDIRAGRVEIAREPLYRKLFPHVSSRVRIRFFADPTEKEPIGPVPDNLIRECVLRYFSNLVHMQSMTEASGGRFVSILQPFGRLHNNAPADERNSAPCFQRFRDLVAASDPRLGEHLDFSLFFESMDGQLPWIGSPTHPDLDEEIIFYDSLHLSDRGNRMVAEAILRYLGGVDQRE